jgi:hypothetical protein
MKMATMSDAYCENANCRVVIFTTETSPEVPAPKEPRNCPGCGQFGRLKDKKGKD